MLGEGQGYLDPAIPATPVFLLPHSYLRLSKQWRPPASHTVSASTCSPPVLAPEHPQTSQKAKPPIS